jgi:hypothetical protein
MDIKTNLLPTRTNSSRLPNILFLPRSLLCLQLFLSVSASVDDTVLDIQHNVAVEKLPSWCFRGAFALMGRSREICQQLLNGPFNEVKAQMVRLQSCGWKIPLICLREGKWYRFALISR